VANQFPSQEFIPFRFKVTLFAENDSAKNPICSGAFSEVSGFEFTMTPKAIQEGGRNWGEVQLAGNTRFAPISLKRGITRVADLYKWFDITSRQANYAYRMSGQIDVYDQNFHDDEKVKPVLSWSITRAMATKFKGPDLSSTSSQVAIEEFQLVHEGLHLLLPEEDKA
jgi:phage tail-like protein